MLSAWSTKLANWLGESNDIGVDLCSPTLTQANAYFDRYPLQTLLPYESYDPESGLFFNRKSQGFVIEAAPLTGANEETVNILLGLISEGLPANANAQFLLWASPKIGDALKAWQAYRSGRGEIYEVLAKQRIDYLKQGAHASLVKEDAYLIRDFLLLISVTLPLSERDADKAQLISVRDAFLSTFRSIQLYACPISIERFMSVMTDLLNPNGKTHAAERCWDKHTCLSQQLIDPENHLLITKEALHFDEGSWEIRTFSVRDFPKVWAQWGMNDLIGDMYRDTLRLPCAFAIQLSIHIPERDKAENIAQFKRLRADRQASSPLARFMPTVHRISSDWNFACSRLEEGDRLVEAAFQVFLYAPRENANVAEMALKNLFNAKGWKIRKDRFIALQSWLSMFPMMLGEGMAEDLRRFGRLRTLPSMTVVNLLPLQAEWKGMSVPRLLLTGRRGQMLWWDNFDNNEGNYNVAVVGKSGSGKSVFMQEIMTALLGSGGQVWVIDVGRSFAKACALLGGDFIEFTPQSSVCINPFTFIGDFDDALSMLKPLLATMAKPTSRMTDHENALLEQALKVAWQQAGHAATITLVAETLLTQSDPRAKDLGTMLFSYTAQGMYGRFFEGRCTLDAGNPLLVLELEELKGKKDLQEVVLMVLMYQVTEAMYRGKRNKHLACIIDEAWDLLRGAASAEFVETGCRRARKYEGAFITGTQSVHDYYKTGAAQAAFENSDWLCLLSQKNESIDELKERKRLALDGHMERLLKSIRTIQGAYAEVMLYGTPGFAVGRLMLDPFSRVLYSSKGAEYAAVQQLQTQGKTLIEAIKKVSEDYVHA